MNSAETEIDKRTPLQRGIDQSHRRLDRMKAEPMNSAENVSNERLAEMLAGLEGVTPGPWQVIEEKHEWSLPERAMMGHDVPAQYGEHLERRIFTTWDHGQLKSPFPVVNSSVGIGNVGEPSVQMVWMQPEDAAHIARCDPDTMRSILTELQALRSPPTEDGGRVEAVAWPPLVDLGRVLGFFASVIKSGEPWTETCQAEYQKANVALQALYASPRPETVGVSDAGLLKALQDNCWDLRCIASPIADTGDADIDWIVIEHHMAKPHEREIGRGSTPLQALTAAISPQEGK